ncbi:unnamed protein product [Linum tenue]|uniref:Leucine-rich repeat-containing N-terminal plant-type domain-containing protein n=1 Tax=Linum tenue TaxID=586396 RepID=A0AAV0L8S4_9ROSI|nr:unnamed protein product [Linum tenue]
MIIPAVVLVSLSWMSLCYYPTFAAGSSCRESEREALSRVMADLQDPSGRLSPRAAGSNGDCCKWPGVVCDNVTGHVTELHLDCPQCSEDSTFKSKVSPSLLKLKHLSYLDMSGNNFQGTPIPGFIGSMSSLNSLFLDESGFGGFIPHQLGNLSNLQQLGLRAAAGDGVGDAPYADSLRWLSGLPSLEYLDLSYVNLSNASDWLNMINTLPSLTELYLSNCRISHNPPIARVNLSSLSTLDLFRNQFGPTSFPSWVSQLKSLTSLDLAGNNLQGAIPGELQNLTSLVHLTLSSNKFNGPLPDWLFSFRHLEYLDISANKLEGRVPNSIGNLTSLVTLDLSFNRGLRFEGGIPASFKSLCHLSVLYLSGTRLNQSVSELLEILGECPSTSLKRMSLSECQLFGQLSDEIRKFKRLSRLSLQINSISGPIPMSFGELKSLTYVTLARNQINGTIPTSFGELSELTWVDISLNSMGGVISPEIHFAKLTKLACFFASGNRMTLESRPDWIAPKMLEILHLNSWYLGPAFPKWLQGFQYLKSLDLSDSGISEPIPDWFWSTHSQFYYLNMSRNQIPGRVPKFISVSYFDSLFDFSWNRLEGPLPVISSNFTALDLSSNLFTGNLLKFLCFNPTQARDTQFLNLQDNFLSGEIPDCWRSWQNLRVLRLGSNNLKGKIPRSIGSLTSLVSLRLQNNSLANEIPSSVSNCTSLVSIDLADNRLEGMLPEWMGKTLSSLRIINFRGNKLHGNIPEELCRLQLLQILDLSHNSLSGELPECISNFSAMANSSKSDAEGVIYLFFGGAKSFVEYQFLVTQGQVKGYSTILNYVRSLDLSWNKLSGKFPKQMTKLMALQYLNMSHNLLSGEIPGDIAAMGSLESLDLSGNRISGKIPPGLASLTFLNHLNLSHNNLSGRIPSSTQLHSFDPSSFIANKGLCGPPLNVSCNTSYIFSVPDSGEDGLVWFSGSIYAGFVVGFWGIVGSIIFSRPWRELYFGFLEDMEFKLWTWLKKL